MKILLVSDIHLNLSKEPEWESNRFSELFKELARASEDCDMTVLSGDIFDNPKPTLQEIHLFYSCLNYFKEPPIIIDGNHECLDKQNYTWDFLPSGNFEYTSNKLIETKSTNIYLCGHKKLYTLKYIRGDLKKKKNILITHVRSNVPPHIKEEFDCRFLSNTFDLVVSGDIHYRYSPFDNFHYLGQPYSTTYKPEVTNGYAILDTDTLELSFVDLGLPSKIKIDVNAQDLNSLSLNQKNLYKLRVTGSIEELHEVPNNNSNILYEKVILTSEVQKTSTHISEGKVDIVNTLIELTKETFDLSEETVRKGEEIISGICSRYTN